MQKKTHNVLWKTGFRAVAIIFFTSERKVAHGNDAPCCDPLLENKIAQA